MVDQSSLQTTERSAIYDRLSRNNRSKQRKREREKKGEEREKEGEGRRSKGEEGEVCAPLSSMGIEMVTCRELPE